MLIKITLILLAMPFLVVASNDNIASLITAVDVRIGHEPNPVVIKGNKCFYQALASSQTLGEVELIPTKKICNSVETKIQSRSILIKAEQLTNTTTGEKINTVKAETSLNISVWANEGPPDKVGCELKGKVSKVGTIVTIPLENGELLTTVCAQLATSEYLGNKTNRLINESFVWVKFFQ